MRRSTMLLIVAGLVALAQPAAAVPTLYLSDGVASVTIADGSALDMNPAVGVVTFIGAIGAGPWVVNVSTGITEPVLGSPTSPSIDLSSVDVSTGPGTLTIRWSDDGFGPTPGVQAFIGGTTNGGGSVRYSTFGDPADALCIVGPCVGPLTTGLFVGPAYSGGASASTSSLGSPFSLTQEIVITHLRGGSTSFNASVEAVPEPVTLLLLGSGLTGLAIRRRRQS